MWKCTKCDEMVEDSFDACWNCRTTIDGIEDPNFVVGDRDDFDSPPPVALEQPVHTCSRCGSQKVIPGVRILDHITEVITQDLKVRFDRAPNAWLFKGSETSPLLARICCGCGLVELFATDRERLWEAYHERQ